MSELLGLEDGNPRFQTRRRLTSFLVIFGFCTLTMVGAVVEAAVQHHWWSVIGCGFSAWLSGYLFYYTWVQRRGLN